MILSVKSGISVTILASLYQNAEAGGCEVLAPIISGDESPQIGLIFIPGATIPGAAYLPLLQAVQEHYPGSLWVGPQVSGPMSFPTLLKLGDK